MKRKARIQTGIDDRLVAIYARKSRITNKGDSIGVQFKQSADYAVNQLSLPEDYEFARYEDKGLSGYYSDRPDFQRLLRDIEMGKIKAVACYKLDRISRKTSDLMRLLEYFERHDVTLLVCSNNINTRISTSKIIIQVLAIIAEFERDILTERIQDNLMELAKDGRWLGGKTPTGFSSQRVTTGSGKNKSAISFLVPVQEEKEIVLEIYGTFWETRSLLQTANIINEKYETKHGAKFTTSTIRLILRNPIYCVADEYSYNYFLEHDGNLFGEPSDFDGQHGLTAYNKTDQMKVEDEDSTFFNPKFSQLLTRKPISEWIVSVGRHEGFISSRKWVETQNMLDEIAEKYNRPHRKTNALLSGLMYCPICGKRLRVLPESNRWTNGKPRFKYACPGVRAKECTFKGVEGVTLDEFVIHSLSSLQEEHSDYYRQLLENRVASMIRTDQSEKEYQETKKAIERLNADIAAQVRNLREADDALKRFIQDDIKKLTDELAKREAALRRMEDTQSENQYLIHELNGMKKRLLSFEEFAKDAQPEALFTLVHSIVDRIYITTDGTKQKCQVYIKGCATEDYSDVLGAAGYIEEEPLLPVVAYMPPMCDLDYYSIGDTIMSSAHHMHMFHLPMLRVGRYNPQPEYLFIKRLLDIVISAAALIILSPIFLATAIAIKATDHGPVFYKQTRLTKDGKEFGILKFRSMRVDAEKDGIARLSSGEHDDRITPVGKVIRACRVDELPQLINILRGELSIVGPRPERPEIAAQYCEEMPEFSLRLQAKAGLTGYAQVYGKYNTTPYDKLTMDLMYIAHPSIIEDLKIMFATVKILFVPESTEGVAEGATTAMGQENDDKMTV